MTNTTTIVDVGVQDPELNNSPIVSEMDEDFDVINQETEGQANCFFNNTAYSHNSYVTSGTLMLVCTNGIWLDVGNSDPENL